MMRTIYLFSLLLLANTLTAQSSKTIDEQKVVWTAYNITLQFNKKQTFVAEIHERFFIYPNKQHQFVIRGRFHQTIGQNWEASAGMALLTLTSNNPNAQNNLTIPELRPHIAFIYKQNGEKISFEHEYRAEARFFRQTNEAKTALEDDFYFGNFRLRYHLKAKIPLIKRNNKQSLSFKLQDEIFLNVGKNIVTNSFDQNRLYFALNCEISPKFAVEIGYLKCFQQTQTAGSFYDRNILRLILSHKVFFKKSLTKT